MHFELWNLLRFKNIASKLNIESRNKNEKLGKCFKFIENFFSKWNILKII